MKTKRDFELIAKGYPVRIYTSNGYFLFYFKRGLWLHVELFPTLAKACDFAIREVEEANQPIRQ